MIISPDFVWLHFPKCGGVSVQSALRKAFADRDDVKFDDITDYQNIIWHENIHQRMRRDPSFHIDSRKVVCCIRRLPYWLLSRILFEAEQAPGFYTATREMLIFGRFHERDGQTNKADTYMQMYARPRVDYWVRVENMAEDLKAAFSLESIDLQKENATGMGYIKKLSFWFTSAELACLYAANPLWAEVEKSVYGSLLTLD